MLLHDEEEYREFNRNISSENKMLKNLETALRRTGLADAQVGDCIKGEQISALREAIEELDRFRTKSRKAKSLLG